ncbi:MAG: J domain-containing protein [Candidatus Melainabacteria bacterium]|nr:J domain-containing protein [Candidatus Melainabacteria bacterium]
MSWQPPPPPKPPQASQVLNYYQILQVDLQAHPTIIRYAYRFLAAMYHPDNSESGDAEKFKTITEAWRTLSEAGKRQAYDTHLGVKAASGAQAPQGSPGMPNIPKASLSWSEVELRLAVLQVLMEARRKRPQTGGASARMLMDCLNCNMGDIEYVLWYLREKGYIARTEANFMITVSGVDYLIEQLSRTQPLDAGGATAPLSQVHLPATLS